VCKARLRKRFARNELLVRKSASKNALLVRWGYSRKIALYKQVLKYTLQNIQYYATVKEKCWSKSAKSSI
jgi:hypothetical protein